MADNDSIVNYFRKKVILVTGGAGSIGKSLVKKLLTMPVKEVRVLDNNENDLVLLQRNVDSPLLKIILGDIRDKESLKDAVAGADFVFHAAALKHVPLSEYFPFEYVKTNVIGTQNLIEVSREMGVEKFIMISTDKAVEPLNVMGATKLLAERLAIAANLKLGGKGTVFSCVRFGNVLYTKGSVLNIFLNQLRKGKAITVTDPNMTRFIMSIKRAVDLILKASYYAKGGEIFIFKMSAVRIMDLAQAFIEVFAPKFGVSPADVEIKIIGRNPGEKMHEKLMTEVEATNAIEKEDMYVIYSDLITGEKTQKLQRNLKQKTIRVLTSDSVPLLSKEQVKKLLIEFFEEYYESEAV